MEAPIVTLLYNEYLNDKQDNKLNRLKVQLRSRSLPNEQKVYNLDVRGERRPRAHLGLEFTAQELCFLRLEEFQETQCGGSSCCSLFGRSQYQRQTFTRLLLLLYLKSENGEGAKCIKLPLLQPGNIDAATGLRKLQKCIYRSIVAQDELKHWSVVVQQCGVLQRNERVFLGLTKYALVIVKGHGILHYHAFYSSKIEVTAFSDFIKFTIEDKPSDNRGNHDNFFLRQTYQFKTSEGSHIESSFRKLMENSQHLPQGPNPHSFIQHDSLSISAPGTSSDQVEIIPHVPDNNNTSSSGSNGHVARVFDAPDSPQPSTSPTSHTPTVHSSDEVTAFPLHESQEYQPRNVRRLDHRQTTADVRDGQSARVVPMDLTLAPPPTHVDAPSVRGESDPAGCRRIARSPGAISPSDGGLDNRGWRDYIIEEELRFATGDEINAPPPPPCVATSVTHGVITALDPLPNQCPNRRAQISSVRDISTLPSKHSSLMLRSNSVNVLNDDSTCQANHFYVNMIQGLSSKGSVHDDSIYFRYYYNVGLVKSVFSRMSKKIKRRHRMSKEIQTVDYSKLDNHEQWYDRDFKIRDQDPRFCKLYKTVRSKSLTYRKKAAKKEKIVGGSFSIKKARASSSLTDDTSIPDHSSSSSSMDNNSSITQLKTVHDGSITETKSVIYSSSTETKSVFEDSITELKRINRSSDTVPKCVSGDWNKGGNDSDTLPKMSDHDCTNIKITGHEDSSIQLGMNIPPDCHNEPQHGPITLQNVNIIAANFKAYAENNKVSAEETDDDPYWAKNLCISIQQILQEQPSETIIRDRLLSQFDLSASQLSQVEVLLSLLPAENNWRALADYIGLSHSEVSIIEHFCYTYRYLATRVVLFHWMMNMPEESTFDNLAVFLRECERFDVLSVIQNANVNVEAETTYL